MKLRPRWKRSATVRTAPPAAARPGQREIAYAASQLLEHVADLIDEGEVPATGAETLQVIRTDAEIAAEANEIDTSPRACQQIERAAHAALTRALHPAARAPLTLAPPLLAAAIDAASLPASALLRDAAARHR